MLHEIHILPLNKRLKLPAKPYQKLCAMKVFWPPGTTVQFGDKPPIPLDDIDCWPPPIQTRILDLPETKPQTKKEMTL